MKKYTTRAHLPGTAIEKSLKTRDGVLLFLCRRPTARATKESRCTSPRTSLKARMVKT